MLRHGDLRANLFYEIAIDPRRDDAGPIGGLGDDMAPRIDDEGMAIGLAPFLARDMGAGLRWRADIGLASRSPGRGKEPPNDPCRFAE